MRAAPTAGLVIGLVRSGAAPPATAISDQLVKLRLVAVPCIRTCAATRRPIVPTALAGRQHRRRDCLDARENPPKPSVARREARITVAMALLTVTAGVIEATSSWPWAVLLGVAGVVALRLGIGSTNSGPPHPAVIALVALAMGLRSTAALRVAIPGM